MAAFAMTADAPLGEGGTFVATAKPYISEDEKLERMVATKRQQELERRARIFDAKRRVIGVDRDALDAQVEERKQLEQLERERKEMYDQGTLRVNDQLKLMEIEKQRIRKVREQECKEFSIRNLHCEARREYDLNDPQQRKKEQPARVGDDDPKLGISSLQKFAGEDLTKPERVRQQKLAQATWIEQQRFEKAMREEASRNEGAIFSDHVKEITQLRDDLEANEKELRKDMQRAQQEHNLGRAQEASEYKKSATNHVALADKSELEFHAEDPFLNETGPNYLECGRIRRDGYKGSTRPERVEVMMLQHQQAAEKVQLKSVAAAQAKAFDGGFEQTRRQLVGMEREKQRTRRQMMEQMAQENKMLMAESKARKEQHFQEVYNTAPGDVYFNQFGKSTR